MTILREPDLIVWRDRSLKNTPLSCSSYLMQEPSVNPMIVMACTMGYTQPFGWSARGGQKISPYGADLPVESSSTGYATALAAGFRAAVVAEETNASIVRTAFLDKNLCVVDM